MRVRKHAWVVLTITALAFIAIGIFRNETAVVLRKATMICMECIGLG